MMKTINFRATKVSLLSNDFIYNYGEERCLTDEIGHRLEKELSQQIKLTIQPLTLEIDMICERAMFEIVGEN